LPHTLTTSWTLIEAASEGKHPAGEEFARRYAPVIRAYLTARWRNSPLMMEIEDAVQEVFVECFKKGGALGKAEQDRPGGFRAFFFGLVRNMALKFEAKKQRQSLVHAPGGVEAEQLADAEASLSGVFDRAWAKAIMKEAANRQAERARISGDGAVRRVDLLRLRFQEGLPIREIATLWQVDPARLHHEYAKARKEFEVALREILARDHAGTEGEVNRVLADLLSVLA
jgi:RNA polymerase sigma-70 factor (ECF subfamily)